MTNSPTASPDAIASIHIFGDETATELISLEVNDRQSTFVMRLNGVDREYRTNAKGEGLWLYQDPDWSQVKGNGQFWLPVDRKKAIDKIMNFWGQGHQYVTRLK